MLKSFNSITRQLWHGAGVMFFRICSHRFYANHTSDSGNQRLKCKIKTVLDMSPVSGRVPFSSIVTLRRGTLWAITWRWVNGVPLRAITLYNHCWKPQNALRLVSHFTVSTDIKQRLYFFIAWFTNGNKMLSALFAVYNTVAHISYCCLSVPAIS